jgi:NTP pyrophosphatase (non-canonical NTP hydrolase)
MPVGLDDHDALSMLALGVVGEWGEYVEAYDTPQGTVEAGDVCWYIANICTVLCIDLATLGLHASSTSIDTAALSDIAEPIKKHLYHGKDLDKARVLRGCARLYMGIVYSHNIGEVLAANVAKLQARWPDGFRVQA